jgi:transposase-like protein
MNKEDTRVKEDYFLHTFDYLQQTETENFEKIALQQTFISGRECPYCNSHHIVGRGNYRNRKRYLCKECGRSFNDLTKTPFERVRDFEKVKMYIDCMIRGFSIRKSAKIVGISVVTSFDWRHRFLKKINSLNPAGMKDVKEVKAIKVPYSAKGSRKPVSKKLMKSKASVVFACDRVGKVDSDSVMS